MLTTKQMIALKSLQEKAALKDKAGRFNLVARVRATRKGQTSGYTSEGFNESKGSDGSEYYVIRRAASRQAHGPCPLYCDCASQKFHTKYGNPCKHIVRLLAEAPELMKAGRVEGDKRDILLYDPAAIIEALIVHNPNPTITKVEEVVEQESVEA